MEEQPRSDPFSKIALDAAQAAAHHQQSEGSRLVESLNRSEFVDRALRHGVTRESMKLERGLTVLDSIGAPAPFVGLLELGRAYGRASVCPPGVVSVGAVTVPQSTIEH